VRTLTQHEGYTLEQCTITPPPVVLLGEEIDVFAIEGDDVRDPQLLRRWGNPTGPVAPMRMQDLGLVSGSDIHEMIHVRAFQKEAKSQFSV
jgi:hypothetical protein